MKIEILEPGKMTQSGSSLLKLIQNNKTPSLDLFVREAVQNSLDAKTENAKYVSVEFLTGFFNSKKLSAELDGIKDALYKKHPGDNCTFLAVRDSFTVGLTGETDYSKVSNNEYGNVLKLIYEICRPQENEGAGGSWGIGKTVYFRMGIGLVVYYSRILKDNGSYESRLAASLVENEHDSNAMIPIYKGQSKNGIAWWGEPTDKENDTVPVTDEKYISNFLDIFGVEPYTGTQTGTTIIIPYTDEKNLLENNQVEYLNTLGEPVSPFWCSSVEEYLKIAVQRWYAPRLSNPDYAYGPFLSARINGNGISRDEMEPVFQIVQSLYNRANHCNEDDIISSYNLDYKSSPVSTRKILEDTNAGTVSCVKVSRKELRMDVPHNKPDPSVYFNCEQTSADVNKPFVFFVRKPGMIISYENNSKWAPGSVSTTKDEFIFGIFVLNSLNRFKTEACPVSNIEEYVRKSEMADHTSWDDWSAPQFNPRLVSKIQATVSKYISSEYIASSEEHKTKENSVLGKLLGDLLLPPDGFGKQASSGGTKKPNPNPPRERKFSFKVNAQKIKYYDEYMDVPLVLKTTGNKKIKHTAFELMIDTETGKIGINEWINSLRLDAPFTIENVLISVDTLDGTKVCSELELNRDTPSDSFEGIDFSLRKDSSGIVYGLDISSEEEHSIKADITSVVRLIQKDVRPAFTFEKEV